MDLGRGRTEFFRVVSEILKQALLFLLAALGGTVRRTIVIGRKSWKVPGHLRTEPAPHTDSATAWDGRSVGWYIFSEADWGNLYLAPRIMMIRVLIPPLLCSRVCASQLETILYARNTTIDC